MLAAAEVLALAASVKPHFLLIASIWCSVSMACVRIRDVRSALPGMLGVAAVCVSEHAAVLISDQSARVPRCVCESQQALARRSVRWSASSV